MNQNTINELMIGIEIDIKRTDGRIHSAIISSIDSNYQLITVEWFEKGEAKGKELDIEEVFSLNPHFLTKKETNKNIPVSDDETSRDALEKSKNTDSDKQLSLKAKNVLDDTKINTRTTNLPEFCKIPTTLSKKPGNRSKRRLTSIEEMQKFQSRNNAGKFITKPIVNQDLKIIESPVIISEQKLNSGNTDKPIDFPNLELKKSVYVCIRKRPMSEEELRNKEVDIISIKSYNGLTINQGKRKNISQVSKNEQFKFDYVFNEKMENREIFNYTIKPWIERLFFGEYATFFTIGQTGSGKTYTVFGNFHEKSSIEKIDGLSVLSAQEIIEFRNDKYSSDNIQIEISFFEIYNGKIYDLLNRREKIDITSNDDGKPILKNLMTESIESLEDIIDFLIIGNELRTSEKSATNDNSSHSSSFFQIILKKDKKNFSKLNFIDLAGNDRGKNLSSINRNTRMEAVYINKALISVQKCISTLCNSNKKIDQPCLIMSILEDSLVNHHSRICLMATISPKKSSYDNTIDTIHYGNHLYEMISENSEKNKESISKEGIYSTNSHDQKQMEITDLIQVTEVDVVKLHKSLIKEHLPLWNRSYRQIYKFSKKVDYNLEAYSEKLDNSLESQIQIIKSFKDKVHRLNQYLNDEETMNKKN